MVSIKKYTNKNVDLTMLDEREIFGDDEEITKSIDILSDEIYKLSRRSSTESRQIAICWMLGLIKRDSASDIFRGICMPYSYRIHNTVTKKMVAYDAELKKQENRRYYHPEVAYLNDARFW